MAEMEETTVVAEQMGVVTAVVMAVAVMGAAPLHSLQLPTHRLACGWWLNG